MAVIQREMLPPAEQARLAPTTRAWPRLTLPSMPLVRVALLLAGSGAVAFAPDAWLRCIAALVVGALFYVAAYREARRELAADIVRGARRPTDGGAGPSQAEGG